MAVIERLLADMLRGGDALAIPAALERLLVAIRYQGGPGVVAEASSAVDVAPWDLKGKLLDVSIAELAGAARTCVPVYASGGAPRRRSTRSP